MEHRRRGESTGWKSVPQFGEWDQRGDASPNYSMVFGQVRANRKEIKKNAKHLSLGNEGELAAPPPSHHRERQAVLQDDPIMKKRRFLTYINCCIRPY